jgi:hypothetical protein
VGVGVALVNWNKVSFNVSSLSATHISVTFVDIEAFETVTGVTVTTCTFKRAVCVCALGVRVTWLVDNTFVDVLTTGTAKISIARVTGVTRTLIAAGGVDAGRVGRAEVDRFTFIFVDAVDGNKSEAVEDVEAFIAIGTLAIVATISVDTSGAFTAERCTHSSSTFVVVGTLNTITGITFVASAFERTVVVGTETVGVAVVGQLSIGAFVNVFTY